MPSISSLLKSAQATQRKIRNQEEAFAAFEWENSAQTYEDFIAYSNFLDNQKKQVDDSSELLTYETKLRSARRSFTSNEIQRAQMAIMEGRGDTSSKMETIQDLFYQAQENGDLNLSQNLLSQWEALSIKLQNEQEASVKSFRAASDKAKTSLITDLTKGLDDVTLPTGERVTPLSVIARDLEETGGGDITWKAATDTLEALRNVVIDQYESADSQEKIDKLEQKYGARLQDLDKELYFSVGGKRLTLQDVINAAANEELNNPIYSLKAVRNEVTGRNEFRLEDNDIEKLDYVRQIDEEGNEFFVPATIRTDQNNLFFGQSDQGRGLNTQLTDEGEVIGGGDMTGSINAGEGEVFRDQSQEIENRLKQLGIIARQNGTTLMIKLPGESVERQATIQPDGSVRYYDDEGRLIEFGVVDRNLGTDTLPQIFRAGQQREVSPEEVSDFGTQSAFGGTLSESSAAGNRYIENITGRSRVAQVAPFGVNDARLTGVTNPLLAGNIRVGNDFSGFGGTVTSSLLQSAQFTQRKVQQEAQRQAMLQAQRDAAERLQASTTFDLNQTPVRQLTSNGIRVNQLKVAAPKPQPRIYVAPPPKPRKITSVGVAKPKGRITGVSVR